MWQRGYIETSEMSSSLGHCDVRGGVMKRILNEKTGELFITLDEEEVRKIISDSTGVPQEYIKVKPAEIRVPTTNN